MYTSDMKDGESSKYKRGYRPCHFHVIHSVQGGKNTLLSVCIPFSINNINNDCPKQREGRAVRSMNQSINQWKELIDIKWVCRKGKCYKKDLKIFLFFFYIYEIQLTTWQPVFVVFSQLITNTKKKKKRKKNRQITIIHSKVHISRMPIHFEYLLIHNFRIATPIRILWMLNQMWFRRTCPGIIIWSTKCGNYFSFHEYYWKSWDMFHLAYQANECPLGETQCLERLLGLKVTRNLKWNSYIRDAGKVVGFLYRSSKFLDSASYPLLLHFIFPFLS